MHIRYIGPPKRRDACNFIWACINFNEYCCTLESNPLQSIRRSKPFAISSNINPIKECLANQTKQMIHNSINFNQSSCRMILFISFLWGTEPKQSLEYNSLCICTRNQKTPLPPSPHSSLHILILRVLLVGRCFLCRLCSSSRRCLSSLGHDILC